MRRGCGAHADPPASLRFRCKSVDAADRSQFAFAPGIRKSDAGVLADLCCYIDCSAANTPRPRRRSGSARRSTLYLGVLEFRTETSTSTSSDQRKRAMLVVDEALVAVALADRDDRRRAIVEIAQGYSSADPYKDYGRSAVPRRNVQRAFLGAERHRRSIWFLCCLRRKTTWKDSTVTANSCAINQRTPCFHISTSIW